MQARGWWRGTLAVGLVSAGSLGGVALVPLLVGVTAMGGTVSLACLLQIPPTDWGAYGVSAAIIALLLGSGVRGGVTLLRQTIRTRRVIRQLLTFARPLDSRLLEGLRGLQLDGRVDLVQTITPLAFCYGFLQPRVCLSTGMIAALDPGQLRSVLWHERYHLLRRDPLRIALGRAWIGAFFFLPVARVLYNRYMLLKEVEADAYACAQQGSPVTLTAALQALLDLQQVRGRSAHLAGTAGATEELETRVAWLLGEPPPFAFPFGPVLLSAAVLLTIIGLELGLVHAGLADSLEQLHPPIVGGC